VVFFIIDLKHIIIIIIIIIIYIYIYIYLLYRRSYISKRVLIFNM